MLQAVAGRHAAALLAAFALLFLPAAARAQGVDAAPGPALPEVEPAASGCADPLDPSCGVGALDPSAPLEPWDDLEVGWPDLDSPDTRIPAFADEVIGAPAPSPSPDTPIASTPAPAPAPATATGSAARQYRYRVEGLSDGLETDSAALLQSFAALSTLEEYDGAPANAAQVDRRARADAALLAELLRSRGYYDSLVTTEVEAETDGAFLVTLRATPGPLYRFSSVELPGIEGTGTDQPALRETFGVKANDPVDAAEVTGGQAALRVELGRRGFAFAEIKETDILVDHASRTATLVLPVQAGGTRRFGGILIEGRPLFSADHVSRIARFDEGDPYRTPMVDDLRQALVATGLVSTVEIRPVARAGSDLVDLAVALDPAPMRTIAGEAGYGTGEGIRLEASWQHRNLLPPEGAVTFRGLLGTREQLVSAVLRRNNFRRRDQVFNAQIAAAHVDRPAYDARTFIVAGGIERQSNIIWQKAWTWSLGAELVASDERDVDIESGATRRRTFFIGAIPAYLGYDGSNDLLDPTRGFRLSARVSPEASLESGSFFYARVQLDGSFYQPVSDRVTLAARTRLGTIFGASRDRIAPSRRFYAGGGGSVRGYGFQAIGPRDPVFDDPIGGRSLAELAIEARIRFGPFGIVPFIDAGNISTTPLPSFDNLRVGAGIGVRYHTRFGPIRVDVGTPLNPREGDPRIAVNVSLGQAF